MIPVSKATIKTINRFPELYKRQALQVIDTEFRDIIRTTADAFVMASMLAVIEVFHCGTSVNSTKLKEYVSALQDIIDTNADFYDDAVAIGLRNKLHSLGVEYR
jgi:hypothetical protein